MKLTHTFLICLLILLGIYTWNIKEGATTGTRYYTLTGDYTIPTAVKDLINKEHPYVKIITTGLVTATINDMNLQGLTPYYVFSIPNIQISPNGYAKSLKNIGDLLGVTAFANIVLYRYNNCKYEAYYGKCRDNVTIKTDLNGTNCS